MPNADNRVEPKPTQKTGNTIGTNNNAHAAIQLNHDVAVLHLDASYEDSKTWLRTQIPSLSNYSN